MYRQIEVISWKKLKKLVYKRYGKNCYLCRVNKGITMDHLMPVSLGGKTNVDNLRPCCRPCNEWKSDTHPGIIKEKIKGGEMPAGLGREIELGC